MAYLREIRKEAYAMSLSLIAVEREALQLSVADREKLASDIFHSVNGKELNENDHAWIALAEERFQALVSGKDLGIPEKDFFLKVKDRLQWK